MAPTVPSTVTASDSDRSRQVFGTLEGFLQIYGDAEFTLYRKNNAAANLTYADWASSEHVLGPFLYHLTLDAWDEGTSSDDDEPKELSKHTSPDLPEQLPTVTTNGNGMLRVADSSVSTKDAKEKESSSSIKRRQRRKKKYLSEAIVASEDSDDNSTPIADVTTPPSAAAVTNGQTSSLVQRQKKASISVPISQPEDLGETAPRSKIVKLPLFGHKRQRKVIVADPIVSPKDEKESTPVAESVTPTAAMESPEGSTSSLTRRGLRVRTPAQQRPYFHHAKLFEEAEVVSEDEGEVKSHTKRSTTKLAQVVYPSEEEEDQDDDEDEEEEEEEREREREKESSVEVNDNLIVYAEPEPEPTAKVEPEQAYESEPKLHLVVAPEVRPEPTPAQKPVSGKKPLGRPKGRRSKKFEIDEDPEFNAPKNILQTLQPPAEPKPKRKSRGKRSLALSEVYVLDSSEAEMERLKQSDEDFETLGEDIPQKKSEVGDSDDSDLIPSPARKASAKAAPKPGGRYSKPRTKPKKSASIIVSSDNEEDEDFTMGTLQGPKRSKSNPRPKTPEWDPYGDILLKNAQMAAEARMQEEKNEGTTARAATALAAPSPVSTAPDMTTQIATTPLATTPVRKPGRPRKNGSNGTGGSES